MLALRETLRRRRWLQIIISLGPRILVQVFLFTTFVNFFGVPAVERFAKKGVMIVNSMKDTNGIPIPAITLAVENQITVDTCFHQNVSIEECIEKNTLNQSEMIKRVVSGFYHRNEIKLTEAILSEGFVRTWGGRYYTLNLPLKFGPSYHSELFICLNTGLTYKLSIHDPDYFLLNQNPNALPTRSKKFRTTMKSTTSWYYRLELTEVNKLDLPSSPCNNDPSYNFQSCLRRSISAKVFCKYRNHS